MFLAKLKRKSIQKKFRKNHEESLLKTRILDASKIKTIGVLVEESQFLATNVLRSIESNFKISKDNIQFLVFKKFEKEEQYTNNECTFKDFGWYGSLKLNKLQEFVKNDYDLLINYGFEENLYLNMITLQSKSKFKVGFAATATEMYDLAVLDSERRIEVLNAETVKYLKILNKL